MIIHTLMSKLHWKKGWRDGRYGRYGLRSIYALFLALFLLLMLTPVTALAKGGPASTTTLAAGSYIIDISLSQNPPYVDQPLTVTIQPHNPALKLSGTVIVEPGLGTDATNLTTPLKVTNASNGTLAASVHMPVRGAWNISVHLNGPQGSGVATVPVTVGSPGAMPFWLAWTIGMSPLVFIAIWIWHQYKYRKQIEPQSVTLKQKQMPEQS
jgi:hypothetical protein